MSTAEQPTTASPARPLHAVPTPATTSGPPGPGWEPPIDLGADHTLPPFPIHAFPGWLGDQVAAVSTATQTPPDLAGCIALAALSTATGGRALIQVRPGWEEPANIYTVLVLPPASRKTGVFRAMTAPLKRAERELVEARKQDIQEAKVARAAAIAAKEKAERAAGDAAPELRDAKLAEALEAAMQAEEIEIPAEPRLLADDITPEQTATLLSQHGGRLAVLSADGGLFATLAGRYSGSPNLDIFLKGHGGDTHRVDRGGRPTEYIERPAITLGLTVQPAIIDELSKTSLFRGTGLLARILFSVPVNTVGGRLIGAPPVPEQVAARYDLNIGRLVHAMDGWNDPARLAFTAEADALMMELETEIEPKLHPQRGEWASVGDWGGKHAGSTARLAGLLHAAAHPQDCWTHPITADTFTAAWTLGDYFAAHALGVFDRIGADPQVDAARAVLAWITEHGPDRVTKREIFNAHRSRFKRVDALDPVLALLEEHGHLQRAPEPDRPGRGRPPSPTFFVHPVHRREATR
ncbi:YfjI family protein [Crossiella sp. CA-258035]|uniref:YfjI family protein n=1 Tax=Crossiella sp. CA-258035 TaxID=2981138 RepID=UPI0024BC7F01|nr:YfjI family protein [Crossiella sp. CA-258035]WHT21915.1 YfjI family protein [Crossiella sp. CA-258035]